MELFTGANGRGHREISEPSERFQTELIAGVIDQIYRLLVDGVGSPGLIKHAGRQCALSVARRQELSGVETLSTWRVLQDDAETAAHEVAEEIRIGLASQHAIIAWRNLDARRVVAIGFVRDEPDAHLSTEEFALLSTLEPHILRCLRIGESLEARERALDELSEGILLVNSQGEIGFANSSAQQMLDDESGALTSQSGVLTARDPGCREPLRHALSSAVTGAVRQLALACTSSAHPYRATILPLVTDHPVGNHSSKTIAVFFADPNRSIGEIASWLMEGYELTPAEAKVAACIARGRSLGATAAEHEVRPSTVRSHLKQIFAKMGVNRQIEVARTVVLGTSGLRGLTLE